MVHATATNNDLVALVSNVRESATALIMGDIRRYVALVNHDDEEFTLFAPFGGEPRRGMDRSDESLDALASYFQGGEAELEVFQVHAGGDLAVLVAIERQRGKIGDLPEQDWSLRVTLVFRREQNGWRLLHRHADPLTHAFRLDQIGALASGALPTG